MRTDLTHIVVSGDDNTFVLFMRDSDRFEEAERPPGSIVIQPASFDFDSGPIKYDLGTNTVVPDAARENETSQQALVHAASIALHCEDKREEDGKPRRVAVDSASIFDLSSAI
jgi:hypothetical protein